METLSIKDSDELWDKFWSETKTEWFKVETLQDYRGEDSGKSLDAWLKGEKNYSLQVIANEMTNAQWIKDFQTTTFKKTRIHLVTLPYSQYLEWEFHHYELINIPLCKEEVYLVDYSQLTGMDIPNGDFIISDEKRVIQNYYDSAGKAIESTFYTEKDDILMYLNLKKNLLSKAQQFIERM